MTRGSIRVAAMRDGEVDLVKDEERGMRRDERDERCLSTILSPYLINHVENLWTTLVKANITGRQIHGATCYSSCTQRGCSTALLRCI